LEKKGKRKGKGGDPEDCSHIKVPSDISLPPYKGKGKRKGGGGKKGGREGGEISNRILHYLLYANLLGEKKRRKKGGGEGRTSICC